MKKLLIDSLCHNFSDGELIDRFISQYESEIHPKEAVQILSKVSTNKEIDKKLLTIIMKDKDTFNNFMIKSNCKYFNKLSISNKELALNEVDLDTFKEIVKNFRSIQTQYKKISIVDVEKASLMENFYLSFMVKKKLQR